MVSSFDINITIFKLQRSSEKL